MPHAVPGKEKYFSLLFGEILPLAWKREQEDKEARVTQKSTLTFLCLWRLSDDLQQLQLPGDTWLELSGTLHSPCYIISIHLDLPCPLPLKKNTDNFENVQNAFNNICPNLHSSLYFTYIITHNNASWNTLQTHNGVSSVVGIQKRVSTVWTWDWLFCLSIQLLEWKLD